MNVQSINVWLLKFALLKQVFFYRVEKYLYGDILNSTIMEEKNKKW